MEFKKEESDIRGFRYIFFDDKNIITIFQIKKDYVRGGQYHDDDVHHFLLSGKIKYHKERI